MSTSDSSVNYDSPSKPQEQGDVSATPMAAAQSAAIEDSALQSPRTYQDRSPYPPVGLNVGNPKENSHGQPEQARLFLASAVEMSPDAMISVDLSGQVVTWNRAAERVYGCSAEGAIGRSLVGLELSHDVGALLGHIETVQQSRKATNVGLDTVDKAGRETVLEVIMAPVNDMAGEMIGVSIVAREVSRRSIAEEARATQLEEKQTGDQEREVWRVAIESISDYAVFTQDLEGTVTSWNAGAQRVFGWSEADIVGQNASILFTPEDRATGESEKEMKTARATGRAADERVHLRQDGSRFFASGMLFPIRGSAVLEQGQAEVEGFVKVARDLTQQKQAEDEARDREARFRTLSDALPQLIWTNTPDGYANYFNQRWFDYSGLEYEDSAGLGWQIMVHPDDALPSVDRWHQALAAGEPFEVQYRLRRHDGVHRWHLGRNLPLRDAQGNVVGWFGTATDIEDLKTSESAQRESEERYRLLVEGTKDYAMFLTDTDRRIVHWNSGAERVFGYSREEAIGQSGDMIFTPQDRAAGVPELETAMAARQHRAPDQRWHQRKDGSLLWADGIMTALHDEEGKLRGFAKIARDATREREVQEELRAAHDELEMRVEERTRELVQANAALQTEILHRQQVEEGRRQLLHRVVTAQEEERRRLSRELHDNLGQHASAIMISLGMLQTGKEGPESSAVPTPDRRQSSMQLVRLQEQMEGLLSATHRLAYELRPAVLDNVGLVAALQQYVTEWKRNGVDADFVSRLGGKNCTGPAQTGLTTEAETAFYRVVQESLSNVLRHAKASQVGVVLERTAEYVTVIVEDNGVGYDSDAVQSAVNARRMGLRGMHERMELVGGTLSIESQPGMGTTIYARVPLRDVSTGDDRAH
jgi:PAS domain S-box-containing protein